MVHGYGNEGLEIKIHTALVLQNKIIPILPYQHLYLMD